jgi:hypothetical protein
LKVYVDSDTSPLPNEPELVARCLELGYPDSEYTFAWIAIRNPRNETRLFIATSCESQVQGVVELLRAMPSLCELPCSDEAVEAITEDIPASHLFLTTH